MLVLEREDIVAAKEVQITFENVREKTRTLRMVFMLLYGLAACVLCVVCVPVVECARMLECIALI